MNTCIDSIKAKQAPLMTARDNLRLAEDQRSKLFFDEEDAYSKLAELEKGSKITSKLGSSRCFWIKKEITATSSTRIKV